MHCNKDCFHCKFDDCTYDGVDDIDIYKAHLLDKEIISMVNPNTPQYRYNHSKKRKEASKRYLASEKGKATHKKSWENYAKNHPDRMIAKTKLYRETHRQEINERARLYYAAHKEEILARRKERRKANDRCKRSISENS